MGCGQSSNGTVCELSPPAVSPKISRTIKEDVLDMCIETRQLGDVIDDPLPEDDFTDEILELMDSPKAYVQEGQLFSDTDFPASTKSLSFSRPDNPLLGDIIWLRPQDMCEQPAMFVDGISRGDVKQGILGDCWFLSACASIAMRPDLIEKVVPPGQKLCGPEHTGVVDIRFWRFGEWITVPVDDLLPTRDGALVYASCANPSEFWVAFVEKAYAKLHGSYEALAGGHALEAFVDLTGGLAERHAVTPDLYRLLRSAFKHGAFITCARKGDWQEDAVRQKAAENGLVQGHAYTVTDVRRLQMGSCEYVSMVRVRNPWADDSEWTGTWCDSDVRWQSVDDTVKQSLGLKQLDDGEFWMEFADLQREFQEVTISTLGPDFDLDGVTDESDQEYEYHVMLNKKATALRVDVLSSRWVRSMPEHGDGLQVKMLHGSWVPGVNAGGSRNNMDSFATNPQYLITLHEPDDAFPDVNEAVAPRCSILIGLMQEHRRNERNRELRMLCIAFFLYKVSGDAERLEVSLLEREPEAASSGPFTNSREVMGRFELESGRYVLVPATFQPGRARRYMLRVFALAPFSMRELPPSPACSTLSLGDDHSA